MDVRNTWTKDGHDIYCIHPDWISKQSYCLRQSGDDPQHVRRLEFADGALPEALMTRTTEKDGTHKPGYATIDGKPKVPKPEETCGKHPTPFVDDDDRVAILPDRQGDKLLLQITDSKGTPKPGFERPLGLTPDPAGGHYYWTADVQTNAYGTINLYVMLADDDGGDMTDLSSAGVPWIERYLRIEAFRAKDEEDDRSCHERRPSNDKTSASRPSEKFNFYVWQTESGTCLTTGGNHEAGTGSGGHNYP